MNRIDTRVLATVSLDDAGGGVAAVSRLLWRTVRNRWGHDSRLLTLFANGTSVPSAGTKGRFGCSAIGAQVFGQTRWVLFGHLGLARIQSMFPASLQRPYGVFLHGVEVWGRLTDSNRRALQSATLRLANSTYTARRVMEAHPDVGPVFPCPLSLDPDEERPPSEGCDASPRELMVLMVGRMAASEAYKGHAQVIESWPRVVAICPGARLVMAGDGDDVGRLRRLAERCGVAASVQFTGFIRRSELRDLYGRASVFAMPSRGEGFGIVYLEAMAHGLPCVGSTHDAAGDIIQDGVTGFLVRQDDPDTIADRLTRLLSDAGLRDRMGRAGRERQRSEFSYERFQERLVALVEDHLEGAAVLR
jgi:phosphatidylinositol alpha-1,6-mannosyltransferase